MKDLRQTAVFGNRKEPHTVIIARGDEIRHFTVRPWMAALVGSAVAAVAIGYLLATSYLVLRDDLIGAAAARQARMQQSYEDRISTLRAQVDRITSRQLLDQQTVESKVSELLARQNQLALRHGRILERAADEQGALPATAPAPTTRPELRASLGSPFAAFTSVSASAVGKSDRVVASYWPSETASKEESAADVADRLFAEIKQSLRTIEVEQIEGIDALAEDAFITAEEIAEALQIAGLEVEVATGDDAAGGPLVPVDPTHGFDARVRELDSALAKLAAVKSVARTMPIHNPAPDRSISSRFGVRKDPILGMPALHAGIDFRATAGSPVRSAGAGKVVKAGWNGGYGRMVEIDHGDGLTTRYAHMSKILVKKGQQIETGEIVGSVGSSGRSTGPHLHYEVRRHGDAVDPMIFIKAGKRIGSLM